MEKLNYIPVRAGLSERASDYLWSSARICQGCPLENEPLSVDKDLIFGEEWGRAGKGSARAVKPTPTAKPLR